VRVLSSEDRIAAGDALRVVITLERKSAVSAWLIDKKGSTHALLASGPVTLDAGEHALPDSAMVDAPCVEMQLVVAVGDAAHRAPALEGNLVFPLRCQ
jgi:hypothetical protein